MAARASTVLICDDSRFVRLLIARALEGAGLRVVAEAGNGREAVELYRTHAPDLVTLDLVMPELGGMDALRAILEHDPEARVLVCSSMAQRSVVTEALEAGAREFVAKPFQPARLLEAARRTLG